MKKPGLIETTVRLFPDKEFDAATTRTTIKGHVIGRLFCPHLKSRENLLSSFLKKGLASCISCIKIFKKHAGKGKLTKLLTSVRECGILTN